MFEKIFFKRFSVFCFFILFSLSVYAGCLQGEISSNELPQEAQKTLSLIKQNGPFPYGKDGSYFINREGCLPKRKRGYYREFTVKTPRAKNRGARRIISGDVRNDEFYYTSNHYRTFQRVKINAGNIEKNLAQKDDTANTKAKKYKTKYNEKNISEEKKSGSGIMIFAALILIFFIVIYLVRRFGNARR